MLQKLDVQGVHYEIDDSLHKYIEKKIGQMDKYLARHARSSARAEVCLKETKAKDKKQCICEISLHLPKEVLTLHEASINMYAAIDICEAKLKMQLKKYKELHDRGRTQRHLLARWRGQIA